VSRLDISRLDPIVRELFSAGLAPSTRRAYRSNALKYVKFCDEEKLTAFPASEKVLCYFVATLFKRGIAGSSVRCYLAAVRYTQIALGMGDPGFSDWLQLGYVIRGFKKRAAKASSKPRLPITPAILRQLKKVWERQPDQFEGHMTWAVSCLCFFGFLWSGKAVVPSQRAYDPAVHLSVGDIRVDSREKPSFLEVTLKALKTDVGAGAKGSRERTCARWRQC